MAFDWAGLNSLFQSQAEELREEQDPETAGLSGLLADAQRAFLEGSGRWHGGGFGHGSGGSSGGGRGMFSPAMNSPGPHMLPGDATYGRDQFTDPHEQAFGNNGRPDRTTDRQQLGYWDNGFNFKPSRQLLGMAGANPYGVVSKGMDWLTNRHNEGRDEEIFQTLSDAGLTTNDDDFLNALNSMYETAGRYADTENFASDVGYWGNRENIGIPGNANLAASLSDAILNGQLDHPGAFQAYLAGTGGLRPMGGFFQSGWGSHDGPGGMTSGSLHRAVMDGSWGGGGVADFFNQDFYSTYGRRI